MKTDCSSFSSTLSTLSLRESVDGDDHRSCTQDAAKNTKYTQQHTLVKCLHKTVFGATLLVRVAPRQYGLSSAAMERLLTQTSPSPAAPKVQEQQGELVVVKLSDLRSSSRELQQRIGRAEDPVREAQLLAALPPHPSIVKVLSTDYVPGLGLALTMPYASNGDLFDWAVKQHSLPSNASTKKSAQLIVQVRSIFRQLLSALCHVHQHGIAHLDVSPENVLVEHTTAEDILVRLCDFGASRSYPNPLSPLSGTLCGRFPPPATTDRLPGKLGYMPPEVYARAGFDGEKADVWSLGITLIVLLTGNMPFRKACPHNDINFGILATTGLLPGCIQTRLPCEASRALITGMLAPEATRFTLEQVCRQAWVIAGGLQAPVTPGPPASPFRPLDAPVAPSAAMLTGQGEENTSRVSPCAREPVKRAKRSRSARFTPYRQLAGSTASSSLLMAAY
eukprot:g11635.t1